MDCKEVGAQAYAEVLRLRYFVSTGSMLTWGSRAD